MQEFQKNITIEEIARDVFKTDVQRQIQLEISEAERLHIFEAAVTESFDFICFDKADPSVPFTLRCAFEKAFAYAGQLGKSIVFTWFDITVVLNGNDTWENFYNRWSQEQTKQFEEIWNRNIDTTYEREQTPANRIISEIPNEFLNLLPTHTPNSNDRRIGFFGPHETSFADKQYNFDQLYSAYLGFHCIKAFQNIESAVNFIENIRREFTSYALGGQDEYTYEEDYIISVIEMGFKVKDDLNLDSEEVSKSQVFLLSSLTYWSPRSSDNSAAVKEFLSSGQIIKLLSEVDINNLNFLSHKYLCSSFFSTVTEEEIGSVHPQLLSNSNNRPTLYYDGEFKLCIPKRNEIISL